MSWDTEADQQIRELIDGKSVAVVGNALSLFDHAYGAEIDAHDTVIRMNRTGSYYGTVADKPYTGAEAHGTKIDIWAFWNYGWFATLNYENRHRIPDQLYADFLKRNHNILNLEMGKDIPDVYAKFNKQPCLFDIPNIVLDRFEEGTRPSTGYTIFYILSQLNPASVDAYGFDFKKTPTFSDIPMHKKVIVGPDRKDTGGKHNFRKEEERVQEEFFTLPNWRLYDM